MAELSPRAAELVCPVSEGEDQAVWHLAGAWTGSFAPVLEAQIDRAPRPQSDGLVFDCGALAALDMTGAWLLFRLRRRVEAAGCTVEIANMRHAHAVLLAAVAAHRPVAGEPAAASEKMSDLLAQIGAALHRGWRDMRAVLHVLGAMTVLLVSAPLRPAALRPISILVHFSRTCIGASWIILLTSFLVGGIIAQQGGFYLNRLAANIFVVDLSAVLVLREIGLFLAAIIVAGRSGSAITAEIGAMKMREEIDAFHVMGLPATEILVVPRVIALVLALPILCFLSDVAALAGASLVAWIYLDIVPSVFWARFEAVARMSMFAVGLIKAPVMALIIGVTASVEGFKVAGSTESLGRRTTAAVVKSIFLVIVIDGLFAMFFATVGI